MPKFFPEGKAMVYSDGDVVFRWKKVAPYRHTYGWIWTTAFLVIGTFGVIGRANEETRPTKTPAPYKDASPQVPVSKPQEETRTVKKKTRQARPTPTDQRTRRLFLEGYVMEDSNPIKSMEKYLLVIHQGDAADEYVKKARKRISVLKNANRD